MKRNLCAICLWVVKKLRGIEMCWYDICWKQQSIVCGWKVPCPILWFSKVWCQDLKKWSFYPWKIPRWCYRISDISRSILAFSWVWLLTTPNKQNLASKPLFFWVLLSLSLLLYPPYGHFLFLVAKCQCSSSWFDCDWNTANNGKCSCTFYLLHEIKWNWFEL